MEVFCFDLSGFITKHLMKSLGVTKAGVIATLDIVLAMQIPK